MLFLHNQAIIKKNKNILLSSDIYIFIFNIREKNILLHQSSDSSLNILHKYSVCVKILSYMLKDDTGTFKNTL